MVNSKSSTSHDALQDELLPSPEVCLLTLGEGLGVRAIPTRLV